ncbi:MAG: hypothetical protein IIC58_08525 [Proteobacteria bacterium]|nr:hypothetical protein [Pseudomonadota bacterium]
MHQGQAPELEWGTIVDAHHRIRNRCVHPRGGRTDAGGGRHTRSRGGVDGSIDGTHDTEEGESEALDGFQGASLSQVQFVGGSEAPDRRCAASIHP